MIIVAGGDSFIWGSELKDSPHGGPYGYSRNTFSALLSRGASYHCAAYPGLGNRAIARNVQSELENIPGKAGVIVLWTWQSRDNDIDSDRPILHLQNYLLDHGYPYMFVCADNCVVTSNPEIDYSKWYMFPPSEHPWETMEPRGFYQWAVENKYLVGTQDHPLEQAHLDASTMMQETFNELVKKHLQ